MSVAVTRVAADRDLPPLTLTLAAWPLSVLTECRRTTLAAVTRPDPDGVEQGGRWAATAGRGAGLRRPDPGDPDAVVSWSDYAAARRAACPHAKVVLPSAIGGRPAAGISSRELASRIDALRPIGEFHCRPPLLAMRTTTSGANGASRDPTGDLLLAKGSGLKGWCRQDANRPTSRQTLSEMKTPISSPMVDFITMLVRRSGATGSSRC